MKRAGQLGTLLAIGLIVAAVFPWREFQSHSHWAKVRWIPFSPPLGFRDIAVNVALFMPLGAAIAFQVAAPLMIRRAVLAAAALSLVAECTQIFSHSRFPSATDVAANVFGAMIGASIVRFWRQAPHLESELER